MSSLPPVSLVTGATDGIGRATAARLLQQGHQVILHGRNADKLAMVAADLAELGDIDTKLADFASLADVSGLADEICADHGRLDVLVNNAGLLTDHRQLSHDGFELTFAVNYLAPWLLTNRLLTLLGKSAPARVVNVASTAMGGGRINMADLQAEQSFDGWTAYANSKLANVLFSNQLAEKLSDSGVVSNALCPGLIDTNFFHTNSVFANGAYERMRPGMRAPEAGADIPVYLATAAEAQEITGRFYLRGQNRYDREGFRSVLLDWDRDLAASLWQVSMSLLEPWFGAQQDDHKLAN